MFTFEIPKRNKLKNKAMTTVIIKNRVNHTERIEEFAYYPDALTYFFQWCAEYDYDFQTNWTGYTTTGFNDYQVQLIKPNKYLIDR